VSLCFYAAVSDRSLLELIEFYRQDMEALQACGHEVRVASRPSELRRADEALWIWWPTSGAPAVLWARANRRPCVLVTALSAADPTPSGMAAKPPWTRAVARQSLRLADLVLPVSQHTLQGLRDYRMRAAWAAPHGVDTDFHRPRDPGRSEPPYALTISQLTRDNVERKRLRDVVAAAEAVRDAGSELRFVIAGRRADGARLLETEIAGRGLTDRVQLAGRVSREEKLGLLQGASVYVQPTDYESFGLAIAEAMACGVPVVSHAVGAVPEVVGDAGRLLPAGTGPDQLAAAILDVMEGAGRELGGRGRRRIQQRFSIRRRREDVAAALAQVGAS
jgi:glycosyltransferase involved in cell wall biosynthesis